ncbi:tetratricopeptide repeat protein [Tenuifilum thalassicum]|nr:tetratricopeptide repeat protein [Tenuifilum thalassicum]
MNKFRRFTLVFVGFIFLVSCGVALKNKQLKTEANQAFTNNDYKAALASYEQIIESGKGVAGDIYNKAGISAWELGYTDKAINYLENAKKQKGTDALGYYTLAKAYKKVDNLSREIINLQLCVEAASTELMQDAKADLFDAYVRSENWNLADSLWNDLSPEFKKQLSFSEGYLKVKRNLNDIDEAQKVASEILQKDKKNIEALEFLAQYYYNKADKLYIKEMKAYRRNKTMKQYKRLTKALKQVNVDFKRARGYFETLYKLKPDKKYAKYLGNIYTRFENKQKASYWYKRSK